MRWSSAEMMSTIRADVARSISALRGLRCSVTRGSRTRDGRDRGLGADDVFRVFFEARLVVLRFGILGREGLKPAFVCRVTMVAGRPSGGHS